MENTNSLVVIKSGPKDFFLHLLATITFYASMVAFIALLFAYIDVKIPDLLYLDVYGGNSYYLQAAQSTVRWTSAVLLVIFPVFILLSRIIGKEYKATPEKRELKVRKWLAYFTIFLSAVTLIVDLVTLIYKFYGGDYSWNFFAKVLVVLFVMGFVFIYYLWDLRRDNTPSAKPKITAWVAGIIVLVAVISGFFIVGLPANQRDVRFDQQRLSNLQSIQYSVTDFWQAKGSLPQEAGELKAYYENRNGSSLPTDPETKQDYEFYLGDTKTFYLCAQFTTKDILINIPGATLDPSGRGCLKRVVDKDTYPVRKPIPVY